jgi:hypothetical protein
MTITLNEQAIEILRKNDRGGFTVPTARLYPYQWNWDSAFVALGFATFDRVRAWRELELLVEGQWPNGMIPHIIFRRDDPDYFPGPSVWRTEGGKFPSGGISQPPVLASIILSLMEQGGEEDRAKARALFDAVYAWHNWFHTERTPDGHDIVCTIHPWETGRDNCPDWELGLNRMEVDPNIDPYVRKDTEHADASQRPSKTQYDKFVTIIKAGRDLNWDQKRLTNEGPFLMADPGIHFILLRADRDLLKIAQTLGLNDHIAQIQNWIDTAVAASDFLWNEDLGAFCAREMRSGEISQGFSSASALCFYADAGTPEQRARSVTNMERIGAKVKFMLPSWDPDAHGFEAQRYWCGPVWPQMNHIISEGLAEQGEAELANRIRNDLASLIQQSGFYECFNPVTGAGCIGTDFSWTAAMWLAWATPTKIAS